MLKPNKRGTLKPIHGTMEGKTEKAFKFLPDGRDTSIWLPQSLCEWDGKERVMWIPDWLIQEKDL